ncbi:MAG TPA: NAD(P)H-hydrate dehydratase, partial [Accumulibacter sp.]|nr:NAD(P)H-hydrate dehydratase [Accumulibacter sp.]
SGRVYLGLLDPQAPAVDWLQPEGMLRDPLHLLATALDALACGPGMGDASVARDLLDSACALDLPLLLDADALNLLARTPQLEEMLIRRATPGRPHAATLLTPHPSEAARLLGCTTEAVQADRAAAARQLAQHFHATVVVKGCGSIVATANGDWFVNTTGNPGLATAGTGDVLSGLTIALLAQGWPAPQALLAAVHLHGAAADDRVADGHGPIGLTAGELIDCARRRFNRWVAPRAE